MEEDRKGEAAGQANEEVPAWEDKYYEGGTSKFRSLEEGYRNSDGLNWENMADAYYRECFTDTGNAMNFIN
jgi:hypothetical protein